MKMDIDAVQCFGDMLSADNELLEIVNNFLSCQRKLLAQVEDTDFICVHHSPYWFQLSSNMFFFFENLGAKSRALDTVLELYLWMFPQCFNHLSLASVLRLGLKSADKNIW